MYQGVAKYIVLSYFQTRQMIFLKILQEHAFKNPEKATSSDCTEQLAIIQLC